MVVKIYIKNIIIKKEQRLINEGGSSSIPIYRKVTTRTITFIAVDLEGKFYSTRDIYGSTIDGIVITGKEFGRDDTIYWSQGTTGYYSEFKFSFPKNA